MKKNTKKTAVLSAVLMLIFSSCNTIQQPEEVFVQPDYTEREAFDNEVKRIDEIGEKNTILALWRSSILNDAETIKKYSEKSIEEYKEALKNEDWFNAARIYSSLENLGVADVKGLEKSAAELEKLYMKAIPVTNDGTSAKNKVSSYIEGTVTVWVDRGVKVENGVGYADRVLGSGFFISKDGYLVTNHHVIADVVDKKSEKYSKAYVKLAQDSDTRIPAKVVGWDPLIDLALLKVEVDAPYVFKLGSSADLDTGDRIYAIGSPIGLERTLTSGIVSATDRKLFSLGDVMQIDAAVNQGNSGGPCIDENGNVQAIVFAGMLQYEGLNFAIPVEYLKAELPALFNGGKVTHPWLASFGHTKKEMRQNVGLEVQYIMPGGSASRAGLIENDVLTAINGQKITTLEDMQNTMMKLRPQSIVKIEYKRGDEKKSCAIYLAERPENPGYAVYTHDVLSNSFIPIYGMKLVHVSTAYNKKYRIIKILRGSVADESGFSESDPVTVRAVEFNDDKSIIYTQVETKNRKKGYLDMSIAIGAQLDSPYYF